MTLKAVLLDLDDTLVHTDTDLFTQRYLDLSAAFIAARFPAVTADQFKKTVISATRQVSRDLNPMRLNQDVINAAITSGLPVPSAEMGSAMAEFFDGPYRTLSSLATPIPGTQALVDWLLAHNITVVVATNPLYPSQPTYERLRWAGFDPEHPGFTLITSAENSHFTKPHLAYYAEILAKIGVDPAHALMVGDSFENDIQPALAAGMAAYWTMPKQGTADPAPSDRFGRGSLLDLAAKLADGWPPSSEIPSNSSPVQVTAHLTATIAALSSMSAHFKNEPYPVMVHWTDEMLPSPSDLLSPFAVMLYWNQLEVEFNRPTLERIGLEDNPFISLPQFSVTLRAQTADVLVKSFCNEREQTLFFLATLSAVDWSRPARDAVFGPTTLLDMANLIQRQDRQLLARLYELIRETKEQP